MTKSESVNCKKSTHGASTQRQNHNGHYEPLQRAMHRRQQNQMARTIPAEYAADKHQKQRTQVLELGSGTLTCFGFEL